MKELLKKWLFKEECLYIEGQNRMIARWATRSATRLIDQTLAEGSFNQHGGRYKIIRWNDGRYMFILIASNGKELAESQLYSSKQACMIGIAAVRKFAVNAEVYNEK